MIVATLVFACVSQSVPVKPGGTLGERRYRFLEAVQEKLVDDFDEETLSNIGESGAWAHIMFPVGSSERMYFFEHRWLGTNPKSDPDARCRLRGYQLKGGKASLLFSADLSLGSAQVSKGAGTLEKFVCLDQKFFSLPTNRSPELVKALQENRALASYSHNKIGGELVYFVGANGKESDGVRPIGKRGALPISQQERKLTKSLGKSQLKPRVSGKRDASAPSSLSMTKIRF